jgi:hypothetical protein
MKHLIAAVTFAVAATAAHATPDVNDACLRITDAVGAVVILSNSGMGYGDAVDVIRQNAPTAGARDYLIGTAQAIYAAPDNFRDVSSVKRFMLAECLKNKTMRDTFAQRY